MSGASAPGQAPGTPRDADQEPPEERFAFALSDGRVGVLAVRGRKVGLPATCCRVSSKEWAQCRLSEKVQVGGATGCVNHN